MCVKHDRPHTFIDIAGQFFKNRTVEAYPSNILDKEPLAGKLFFNCAMASMTNVPLLVNLLDACWKEYTLLRTAAITMRSLDFISSQWNSKARPFLVNAATPCWSSSPSRRALVQALC